MKLKALLLLLMVFTLTGCSAFGGATPQPLPTIVLGNQNTPTQAPAGGGSSVATASGVVAPAQQAQLVFTSGGKIKTVHVAANDQVKAGQVLVTLAGGEKLTADVESANMELLAAQQALDALY